MRGRHIALSRFGPSLRRTIRLTDTEWSARRYKEYEPIKLPGKVFFVCCAIAAITAGARLLGASATFLAYNVVLSVYLASLFQGRLRYAFLAQPLLIASLSIGYVTPFSDIGIGSTYLETYQRLVEPVSLQLDLAQVLDELLRGDKKVLGIGSAYVGAIHVFWIPDLLFASPSSTALYFFQSAAALAMVAVIATLALHSKTFSSESTCALSVYSSISPTILELNSNVHRYSVMIFGLFLFLISFVAIGRRRTVTRFFGYGLLALVGLACVAVSKPPMLYSIMLFIILEAWARDSLPIVGRDLRGFPIYFRVLFYCTIAVVASIYSARIVPEDYAIELSRQGGEYARLQSYPVIGLVVRLVYASLSPFPWFGFGQMDIYGGNEAFFVLHIISGFLCIWIAGSVALRIREIMWTPNETRVIVVFGLAVLSSLQFSAVGFHAYVTPGMMFLAVVLFDARLRISPIYPLAFCAIMEVIAQVARLVR